MNKPEDGSAGQDSEKHLPATSVFFQLALELSSLFIAVADKNLEEALQDALHRIINLMQADYCAIYKVAQNGNKVEQILSVDANEIPPPYSRLEEKKLVSALIQEVLCDKTDLSLRMEENIPAAVGKHRARLEQMRIESLLLLPISSGTSPTYIFTLALKRDANTWSKPRLPELRLLAEIIVSGIYRSSLRQAFECTKRHLSAAQRVCCVGSWEWDAESGRIVKIESLYRIIGVKPHTQKGFMSRVETSDRGPLQEAINSAFSTGTTRVPVEYRIRARHGEIRIARSSFELVQSESATHMIGTFQDITDARQSDRELQLLRSKQWHAHRIVRIGVLLASLAHELSQPLAAILSNAQAGLRLLDHDPCDRQEMNDIFGDIVTDNRRATRIIELLRTLVRREKSKRVRINASEAVRYVMALLHNELFSQNVKLELACDSRSFLLADRSQIEQVLLELVLNSIEAMRSQPEQERHLTIRVTRATHDKVVIAVSDTGSGITEDQLCSIFEPFWTTKLYGLGMGLTVCRAIIESHGGRIWAENNQGRGATFLFSLPAA